MQHSHASDEISTELPHSNGFARLACAAFALAKGPAATAQGPPSSLASKQQAERQSVPCGRRGQTGEARCAQGEPKPFQEEHCVEWAVIFHDGHP